MFSDLSIEIFDWPDTFFVEAKEPDRDYVKFYPDVDPEVYPYLVDISEPWCDCRDFRFYVAPFIGQEGHRTECSHIIAARRYRNLLGTKPKKLPDFGFNKDVDK